MRRVVREEISTVGLVQEVIRYHACPWVGQTRVSISQIQHVDGDDESEKRFFYIEVLPLAMTLQRMLP